MATGRTAEVLAYVREHGVVHPRDVQAHFGHERAANGWGGSSSATTLELELLHHYGLLRVADRVAGIRRYELAPPVDDPLDPAERVRGLALLIARTMAPATEATPQLRAARPRPPAGRGSPDGRPPGDPRPAGAR